MHWDFLSIIDKDIRKQVCTDVVISQQIVVQKKIENVGALSC